MRGVAGFDPQRMARARAKSGLSYRTLASRVGVSYGTVVGYQQGHTRPRPGHLVRMAAALNCTVTYLAPLPRAPTLADYRDRAGFTLEEMGRRVGRHAGSVGRIERGIYWPADDLDKWAGCYGLQPEEFTRAWRRAARS